MSCAEAKTQGKDADFYWDKLGDSAEALANRCPKCHAPFEKISGCHSMICAHCKHKWCWLCGLPTESVVHYAQFGGIICSMVGFAVLERRHAFVQGLFVIGGFLSVTAVITLLSLALGIVVPIMIIVELCKNGLGRMWTRVMTYGVRKRHALLLIPFKLIFAILFIVFTIVLLALILAIGLLLSAITFSMTLIPAHICFVIALYKSVGVWSPTKQGAKIQVQS